MAEVDTLHEDRQVVLWHLSTHPHKEREGVVFTPEEARERGQELIDAAGDLEETQEKR